MRLKHTLLLVQDISRAKRFYADLFSMKIIHDFGTHVTLEGGLALHEASHYEMMTGKTTARQPEDHHSAVYFESDDIISDYHRLEQAKTSFLHPIEMQSWNQQVFRCFDPDGHLIEVGESMRQVILRLHKMGKNPREIIDMTHLPQDYVELVLDRAFGDRQLLKS